MTAEEWRPVVGFPRYEVSNLGRIKSLWSSKPRIRRLSPDDNGYLKVELRLEGAPFTRKVHTLVAAAFHGPRPAGAQIRHLDGCKTNNVAANLRYGSMSENQMDAVRHGAHYEASRTTCPQGHPYSPENTARVGPGGRKRRCRICQRAQVLASQRRRAIRDAGISNAS